MSRSFQQPDSHGLKLDSRRMMIGVVVALVVARVYYEWILQYGRSFQVWFASQPVTVISVLLPMAVVGSYAAGWAVRRWVGKRLIILSAVLGGVAATAMVNGVIGAVVGLSVGVMMASTAWRMSVGLFLLALAHVGFGVTWCIAGAALSDHLAGVPRVTQSTLGFSLLCATVVSGTLLDYGLNRWTKSREKTSSATPVGRWVQFFVGALFTIGALRIGIEAHRGWQYFKLQKVGYVSLDVPRPTDLFRWELVSGRRHLIHPTDVQLFRNATRHDWQRLRYFRDSLRAMWVEGTELSTEDFTTGVDLPELEWVWFVDTPIDDSGVQHILSGNRVTTLALIDTQVSDQIVSLVGKLPIANLHVVNATRTQSAAYTKLANCNTLEWLRLDGVELDDSEVAAIAALPRLRYLSAADNKVTGSSLEKFVRKGALLSSLNLGDNPLDTRHLIHLIRTPLQWLDLNGVSVDEAGWRAISQLRRLQQFSNSRSGDNGRHLATMVKLFPSLQTIVLDGSAIDAKVINLPVSTVWLRVDARELSDAEIQRLVGIATSLERRRGTDAEVELVDCHLDRSAVVELLNAPFRLFTLHRCSYPEQHTAAVAGHALIRVD